MNIMDISKCLNQILYVCENGVDRTQKGPINVCAQLRKTRPELDPTQVGVKLNADLTMEDMKAMEKEKGYDSDASSGEGGLAEIREITVAKNMQQMGIYKVHQLVTQGLISSLLSGGKTSKTGSDLKKVFDRLQQSGDDLEDTVCVPSEKELQSAARMADKCLYYMENKFLRSEERLNNWMGKRHHLLNAVHHAQDQLRSEVNSELNFPPNFEGIVLGCIDADFCK